MTRIAKSRSDVYIACHRTKVAGRGFIKGPEFVRTREKRLGLAGD